MKIFDNNGNEISESSIGNPYGFTGRRFDKETGLWYYRNRMYSANLGRFMQRDPAGYVDGLNLYAYVKNNPLKYLDPLGLSVVKKEAFNIAEEQYNSVPSSVISYLAEQYIDPHVEKIENPILKWVTSRFTSDNIDSSLQSFMMIKGSIATKKTHMHHQTPREVLKKHLPPNVANNPNVIGCQTEGKLRLMNIRESIKVKVVDRRTN